MAACFQSTSYAAPGRRVLGRLTPSGPPRQISGRTPTRAIHDERSSQKIPRRAARASRPRRFRPARRRAAHPHRERIRAGLRRPGQAAARRADDPRADAGRRPRSARPALVVDRQQRVARPRPGRGRRAAADDGSIRLIVGIADVDALVPQGHADRRARGRQLHVGLHRHRRLSDAAGKAVDRSHVAERRRGSAGDRHRDGRRRRRRRRVVRRLPRDGAQQGEARLRRRRRVARRRGRRRRRSPTTGRSTEQLKLQDEASQRLKAERLRNGALEFDTIEATPVAQGRPDRRPQGHAQEPRARSDRGFHDRQQRRDREVPRGAAVARASAAWSASRSAGRASSKLAGRYGASCPTRRTRSRSRTFSSTGARPIRSAFRICRSRSSS